VVRRAGSITAFQNIGSSSENSGKKHDEQGGCCKVKEEVSFQVELKGEKMKKGIERRQILMRAELAAISSL